MQLKTIVSLVFFMALFAFIGTNMAHAQERALPSGLDDTAKGATGDLVNTAKFPTGDVGDTPVAALPSAAGQPGLVDPDLMKLQSGK
uniref:Uncharacterized protein n=1 Tax=Tetranychus urticae TaxID=32264 RepID=T1K145_TETUR